MSLAIQKFADGGSSQVRTYKRGNDEVDLNDFIRQAEANFDDWLNNTKLKKKHKEAVREAYRDILTRVNENPESFTARLGGGFTNTAGITNAEKGFDAYGVAAGYLGNTLRNMPIYTKPEALKSTKLKYDRNNPIITENEWNQIWGSNPDNFIRMDPYDEATGQRGITNRKTQIIAGLGALRDNIGNNRDFESDEDKQHFINKINETIAKLQNSDPNDDWFYLGQLGATKVADYLFTGETQNPVKKTAEEQEKEEQQNKAKQFEDWISTNYPQYEGTLNNPRTLSATDPVVTDQIRTDFYTNLGKLSTEDLQNMMYGFVSGSDLRQSPEYWYMYADKDGVVKQLPSLSNDQIAKGILTYMRQRGLLQPIEENSNKYFIPGTVSKDNTAYIWDGATGTLQHVSIHDIPYIQKQIVQQYLEQNPQSSDSSMNPYWQDRYSKYFNKYKEGGILKFQDGGTTKYTNVLDALFYTADDLTADKRLRSVLNNEVLQYLARENVNATDNINSGNNQYDPEAGGKEVENAAWYNPWIKILTNNASVAEAFARRYRELQPHTNHYKDWFNSDDSFNFENFKTSTTSGKQVWSDAVNGIGHDFYRGRAYQVVDENGQVQDGYYNGLLDGYELVEGNPTLDETGLVNIYQMRKKAGQSTVTPEGQAEAQTGEQTGSQSGDQPKEVSHLDEVLTRLKKLRASGFNTNKLSGELWADILGTGRLVGSIYSNNRIARTVKQSLVPKLHNTYELYSPITGAFSEMQLRNRQAADIMSRIAQPFTSDGSLATARMLEANRQANDLRYQGFLADDREIKRTSEEALKRVEGNVARRSQVANENMDSIIANNQARAQLEAARQKANWGSISTFLAELEGRVRQRAAQNRERYQNFSLQTSSASADQWRRQAMNQLRDKYNSWMAADPSRQGKTFTDWMTENQDSYIQAIQDINAVTEAMKYQGYANTYGLKYNWPTYKNQYGQYKPIDFNINNYTWLKRQGGTLNKKK